MSREKNFTSQKGHFQIFGHKNQKKIETLKIEKNAFFKTVLDIFCQSKTTGSIAIYENFVKITGP
jgi:hypothetical protein